MKDNLFSQALDELILVAANAKPLTSISDHAGEIIVNSLKNGNKLITCGNGGSAADALHLAEELVGRYRVERRALPAICLCADVTAITCIGNDYGYDHIFERQIQALGKAGDVLVGFTTSGNSSNVNLAFQSARNMGITTVLLSGKDGGAARGVCDVEVIVPSYNTARIQEIHTVILHSWLERIDGTDWSSL
jgi:phosphoheptose isomerase